MLAGTGGWDKNTDTRFGDVITAMAIELQRNEPCASMKIVLPDGRRCRICRSAEFVRAERHFVN